jgi:alpha-mannosidase
MLEPGRGKRSNSVPLIGCENRNIVIEAVKKSEEGNDLIVRLYECHNSRGKSELACSRTVKSAALCDLEENEVEELEVMDGLVSFHFKPFEILTIKLRV